MQRRRARVVASPIELMHLSVPRPNSHAPCAALHVPLHPSCLDRFIKAHSWTTVSAFSDSLVNKDRAPRLVASLLVDTRRHAKKLRYIVKQYHKLIDVSRPARGSACPKHTRR